MPSIYPDPYFQNRFSPVWDMERGLTILEFFKAKLGNKDSCTFVQYLISFYFVIMAFFPYFSPIHHSLLAFPQPPTPHHAFNSETWITYNTTLMECLHSKQNL